MAFMAFLTQPGGCDYTIGCGHALISLRGNNLQEALVDLKKKVKENYTGERSLSAITLIEGKTIYVDAEDLNDKIREEKKKAKELRDKLLKEKQDKAEYARLKKKFEG
jgi:hypothetical protein